MNRRGRVLLLVMLTCGVGGIALWYAWPDSVPPVPVIDSEGKDPAVIAAIEKASDEVRAKPRSADAWGRLGLVLGAHGYTEEALPCLDTAARLDPKEPCWPYVAGVLVEGTNPAAAIPRLRVALSRAKGPAEGAQLRLAGLLLTVGEFDEAEAIYRRLLSSREVEAWASQGLTRVDLARGKSVTKVVVDPQAGLSDPPDPWHDRLERAQVGEQAQLRRADQLLSQNKIDAALPLLAQTTRDYPRSAAAWQAFGRVMLQARRLPQAGEAFRKAHELEPQRVEVMFYLGVVAYEQGDRARAAVEFARTTSVRPDHALAWYNLGQCRREFGDKEGAVAAFRKAVHYKPHHAGGHFALARLLLEMKRLDEARRHLDLAAHLTPKDPEVEQLRQTLSAGK